MTQAAIGIDVGGTKVALGIVTTDGGLSSRTRIENRDASDAGALLDAVAAAAAGLADSLDAATELVGVGVGICELVDTDGEIRSATSIPWTREQVVRALAPVGDATLDADVRAAALAEAQLGAGRRFSSFVHITVGTGISHCLVQGGVPYAGSRGFAQLIGSAPVSVPCPACGSTAAVALEDVAGGPALVRRYNAASGGTAASAEDVLAKIAVGDPAAAAVVDGAATTLGSFVALLVNVFDPAGVVIGGGLGSAAGPYWDSMLRSVRTHVWSDEAREIPVERAELGADAGVVGAGLTALSQRARRRA